MKPILCLDFDGVIHSYSSGWKGPRTIPDAPVDGALQFIIEALETFEVQIFSSRSNYWFGRFAMKCWLRKHLMNMAMEVENDAPDWWLDEIRDMAENTYEPWHTLSRDHVNATLKRIKWPTHKPPALVTIDDRALTFDGHWPSIEDLKQFKPWNKKPKAA
ncbi:hypothetical protein [Pandoraea apista]|uniref:hypothetical protein n=1 Tax=Pandoraea apista TaxID=93218 RepID=UPI000B8C5718|nr:hypothetical protein [Pandoraea apista]OXS92673.1 hypothetical protein B7H01_17200 [Pandoraea apista]